MKQRFNKKKNEFSDKIQTFMVMSLTSCNKIENQKSRMGGEKAAQTSIVIFLPDKLNHRLFSST